MPCRVCPSGNSWLTHVVPCHRHWTQLTASRHIGALGAKRQRLKQGFPVAQASCLGQSRWPAWIYSRFALKAYAHACWRGTWIVFKDEVKVKSLVALAPKKQYEVIPQQPIRLCGEVKNNNSWVNMVYDSKKRRSIGCGWKIV